MTGKSDGENSSSLNHSQRLSQLDNPSFQPIFQTMDAKSSASSNLSSPVVKQNETYAQTSSSPFPRHPREPLTQYQTYPPGISVPSITGPRGNTIYPQTTLPGTGIGGTTIFPQTTLPGTGIGGTTIFPQTTLAGAGTLPESAVTFPPSVFPPTTSFIPPTSIAPVVGPLSPWFPSIPAIACGGTFTFSVVGSLDRDIHNGNSDDNGNNKNKNENDNNDDDKDKLYAIQIQSNGGSTLDTDSIEGKVFAGEKNIERNNGEDFDVKDVFNDCQVVTFSN